MKKLVKPLLLAIILSTTFASCKKEDTSNPDASKIAGFWTYKEDPAQDYWNDNVLFKRNGAFRMYTTFSLSDTAAAVAIADTANQVVTFGTYTVSGTTVKMTWQEFNVIKLSFSGVLNSSSNNIIGNIETSVPGSASPLWYLTKP